ncbi:MAG TPA: tetratricopeptide repeat protein [Aggregatilineales bacterium]|nr:tetratricopeptide repeat protein [Anaerolineales bacterium]HRE48130.1 tetratricopeptide repeat protein [Aggregatilineales bacterium]
MRRLPTHPFARMVTVAVFALCFSACRREAAPIILVTATPNSLPTAVVIIPTATPIPSPTVPPTPTIAPFIAIAEADTLLHNGNYDKAVSVYRSVLDQPILAVDPALRLEAAFGLGAAARREGRFQEAVSALTEFLTTYPDDPRAAAAYFLRGDAYLGLSLWEQAIGDFTIYLQKRPGLIDSYAHERIGDAYLNLNRPAKALEHYDLAVQSSRGLAPLLALRERLAAGYLNAGDVGKAIAQYDAILEAAQNHGYRAAIALTAANALSRAGNDAAAVARYQAILATYPETPAGYQAMQAILRRGGAVDSFLRGRISFAAEDYADAVTAFQNYTSSTTIGQIEPITYMLLGKAYRELGNVAAANTSFQTIITQYPTSPFFGEAWLEQGRTLFLSNDVQGAITKYMEFAEKHADNSQAAEAIWRAGYLYSTVGNMEQSLATFEILGAKYPGHERAQDGLFRGGMAALNANMPARAQRLFSLLAVSGIGELKAAGYLWLGRLYQLQNETQLAAEAYTQAAKADPGGYYSLRAADLLAGRVPFVPPAQIDWAYNTPTEIEIAETWLRTTFAITAPGPLWQVAPQISNDPRYIRGGELWALSAYEEAQAEFTALTEAYSDSPLGLYQLANYYHRIGHYREAIFAAAKLIDGAKVPTANAPKAIAALRYPIAYYDLVIPTAQRYGLDPLLVFSLMRQESLFQGGATSSAAARGLMQIIPPTGDYIARQLGYTNFQTADLYRPYINVPFGIFYLAEQLNVFDGKVYAALAAYNGGPGNSAEWLRISNSDPDLFVQAITFEETRTYVRRIYEQYEIYMKIYGVGVR